MLCSASRRTGAILLVADSCVVCLVPSCRLRYTVNASTDSGLLMQYRAFQPAELGGTWPTSSITCKYCRRAGCAGKECRTRASVRPSKCPLPAYDTVRRHITGMGGAGSASCVCVAIDLVRTVSSPADSCIPCILLHSPALRCVSATFACLPAYLVLVTVPCVPR